MTVFAFSQGRFSEKELDAENIDPPLPARYFTSRFRYYSSAFVFAGVYVFLYIALIFIGSTPALQGTLKTLFGSLSGADLSSGAAPPERAPEIGTPAWAAMMMMVIAPTTPWVRRLETLFRHWLQRFSNTPYKARELAEEIIETMLSSNEAPPRLDHASESQLFSVFDQLEQLRHELTASSRSKLNQKYHAFFSENGEILTKTTDQFRAIQDELSGSPANERLARSSGRNNEQAKLRPASPTQRSQMEILIRRLARLIVCALLYAESEEYPVRERLRGMPHLSKIRRANFRFTRTQVFLGLFLIALSAIIVGPLGAITLNNIIAPDAAPMSPGELINLFQFWAARSIMYSAAFILPLAFVAAIRLHLIDDEIDGRSLQWEAYLLMLILTFIGCFGLAALPIIAVHAYQAGQEFGVTTLAVGLLKAMPAALANTAFLVFSGIRWSRSAGRNAIFDFVAFAALGGAAGAFASLLIAITILRDQSDFSAFWYFFLAQIPFMFTVVTVSGLNGTTQCAASRAVEAEALATTR